MPLQTKCKSLFLCSPDPPQLKLGIRACRFKICVETMRTVIISCCDDLPESIRYHDKQQMPHNHNVRLCLKHLVPNVELSSLN